MITASGTLGIRVCTSFLSTRWRFWYVWILSVPWNTFFHLWVILYFWWLRGNVRRLSGENDIFVLWWWFYFIFLKFKYSCVRIGLTEFLRTMWVCWEIPLKPVSVLHRHCNARLFWFMPVLASGSDEVWESVTVTASFSVKRRAYGGHEVRCKQRASLSTSLWSLSLDFCRPCSEVLDTLWSLTALALSPRTCIVEDLKAIMAYTWKSRQLGNTGWVNRYVMIS